MKIALLVLTALLFVASNCTLGLVGDLLGVKLGLVNGLLGIGSQPKPVVVVKNVQAEKSSS